LGLTGGHGRVILEPGMPQGEEERVGGVMSGSRELNRLSGELFEQARRSIYGAVATSAIILVLQLAYSVWVAISPSGPSPLESNFYTTVSLLGILVAQGFLYRADAKKSLAHEARRLDLWEVTLGHSIDDYLKREVQRRAGKQAKLAASKRLASEDIARFGFPSGPRLLLTVVCYRGEMTAFQYRWFGAFLLWLLIVPAVLTVFTLYVFLLVAPSATVSHAAARAVAVLVSATLTLQLLVWGLRLKQLSHGIEGVLTSARSVLKANDVLSDQAVVLAGEYNLLISHGVFIPQWVYEHLRDEVTGHEKTPSSEP
jgi:hypothetical protein